METREPTVAKSRSIDYRMQGELPLVVHADGRRSVEALISWLDAESDRVRHLLTKHGAMLFRGFDVREPGDFENISRAIDGDLKNEYLGLSPRNALTDYVFTASEIPGWFPIPEHNEMSFVRNPPRSLFFWCRDAPAPATGETPLADMRRVYEDLDPAVRERFETLRIRIIRNYRGPGNDKPWELGQLKPWVDMFQTTDRAEVEAKCMRERFSPVWGEDDSLKLVSFQSAVKSHPKTGEKVWFNHAAVFHASVGVGELRRVFLLRPSFRSMLALLGAIAHTRVQSLLRNPENLPMHCTFGDGSPIPDADMESVRTAIWNNMVITPWLETDVLAIDNDAVGHGRLPFYGPRMIAVAWA